MGDPFEQDREDNAVGERFSFDRHFEMEQLRKAAIEKGDGFLMEAFRRAGVFTQGAKETKNGTNS